MDTVFKQEELIFGDYNTNSKSFVKDGLCFGHLISEYSEEYYKRDVESLYNRNHPRVVFVCKEPNKNGGEDYRFWDWVKRESNPLFGDSIARWLIGILGANSKNNPQKPKTSGSREVFAKHPLVLMNIKKTAGGSNSKWDTIRGSARENAALLQKQISLYAPNLVFCCGSSDNDENENRMINIVKEFLYPDDVFEQLKEDWHYCYYSKKKQLLLIDSYHPSYVKKDTWKFDNLFKEYRSFLKHEGESWFAHSGITSREKEVRNGSF